MGVRVQGARQCVHDPERPRDPQDVLERGPGAVLDAQDGRDADPGSVRDLGGSEMPELAPDREMRSGRRKGTYDRWWPSE